MITKDEINERIRKAVGSVAELPAGYALLGRGDGAGAIVASFTARTVYISGTNVAGQARLAQSINITLFTNPAVNRIQFEGVRVKLGYPNYDPKVLYVTSFDTGEGMDALGGLTLNEQQQQAAQYPDIGKITNLRLMPDNPPSLNIFVAPTSYYDLNGQWHWFGGDGLTDDFTDDVAALSGQHQMAVVYLDVTTGELGRALSPAVTGGVDQKDTLDVATIDDLADASGFSAGQILCGAVHLYDGQTTIEETDVYRSADPRVIYQTPGAGGTDTTAIHADVAGEIAGITQKATPVSADKLLIEDSADSDNKKYVEIGDLPGGSGGNIITVGTYAASRPVSPSVGDLYVTTDGRFSEVWDGSAWKFTDSGKVFVKPSSLSWAWVNQSSAGITSSVGIEHLDTSVSGGGQNVNLRVKSAPTAPYKITTRIEPSHANNTTYNFGILFRESSSGKFTTIGCEVDTTTIYLLSNNYTNPTTFISSNTGYFQLTGEQPKWFQIEDDNTNRIYRYSWDGLVFYDLWSEGRTVGFTANQVGFCINPFDIVNPLSLTLLTWIES